jgi:RecB family exonuclease
VGLRVIVGGANAGKTGVALSVFREWREQGRRPVLVVPTAPDVVQFADELARDGALGVHIKTPGDVLDNLWAQTGDDRQLVSDVQRELLLRVCVSVAGLPEGMVSLAARCVRSLASQVGEAWRHRVAAAEVPDGEGLSALLEAYARRLEQHALIEPAEAATVIRDAPIVVAPHVFHRFADFAEWQFTLVEAVSQKTDVLVTVTWEPENPSTKAMDAAIARFGVQPETVPEEVFGTDPELVDFAAGLFDPTSRVSRGGAVRFGLASGSEAQARLIAEYARKTLTKSGNRRSVVVAFRGAENHVDVLKRAFREVGVDAVFDARRPLGAVGFGAAFADLLATASPDARPAVLALLRGRFSGIDRKTAREIEGDLRGRGIVEPRAIMARLWAQAPGLAAALEDVGSASELSGPTMANAMAKGCRRLFSLAPPPDATERSRWDAAAQARIVGLLTEVAELREVSVRPTDVSALLRTTTVTLREDAPPGWVLVTSADRIRGRRFDHVVLGGLNAGEFPLLPTESGTAGSAVHGLLAAVGADGLGERSIEHERMLFFTTVTRARHGLFLVARNADSDGGALQVSPFFHEAGDAYRGPDGEIVGLVKRGMSVVPETDSPVARERLRAEVALGSDGGRAAAARDRARIDSVAGGIDPHELASKECFSASEIEEYLVCPYRWFFTRHVRAAELEQERGARDLGSFAHLVLQQAYLQLREAGIRRMSPEVMQGLENIVESAWRAADEATGPARSLREKVDRLSVKPWVARVLGEDADLLPGFAVRHLEWTFGFEDEPVDMGGYGLRGRVDRIDTDTADRAVIIDYKLSKVLSAAQIKAQRKVQIPLYLEAARRRLEVEPVAGLYRGLRSPGNRGLLRADLSGAERFSRNDVLAPEVFTDAVTESLTLAAGAVEGIRAGLIPRSPVDAAKCRECPALLFCGGAR